MYFIYQESMIWESGDPVDPDGQKVVIKARNEERARRKVSSKQTANLGRVWVLVGTKSRAV